MYNYIQNPEESNNSESCKKNIIMDKIIRARAKYDEK